MDISFIRIDSEEIEYIREVGPSAWSLYSYVKMKSQGKDTKFRIKDLTAFLDLSKPRIIFNLKLLKKFKMISLTMKYERGKKTIYMKTLSSKYFLPLSTKIQTPLNYSILRGRTSKIYFQIIGRALKHKRFHDEYYQARKWKFSEKENRHIEKLISLVPDVDGYVEWWLDNKASKVSGLNIGLIACVPMIEEYKLSKGEKLWKKEPKEVKTSKENKLSNEILEFLIKEKNEGKILSEDDDIFFQQCLKNDMVIRENKKFVLRKSK